jgi:hypothetical protein
MHTAVCAVTHLLYTMANNRITLTPIRMGDLVNKKQDSLSNVGYVLPYKRPTYVPPGKAGNINVVKHIDMSDKNFPVLGEFSKATIKLDPIENKGSMCNIIKEKIELDSMTSETNFGTTQEERFKMTAEELEKIGWTRIVVPLSKERIAQLKSEKLLNVPGTISEETTYETCL